MAYEIKLEAFEGPFDLLIHLININEIEVHDIPIHQITMQYLEYLDAMQDLDMDIASEFLVMAATLIEINLKCFCHQEMMRIIRQCLILVTQGLTLL